MPIHAALITVLNVLLLFLAMGLVGRARGRYKIMAPATTGHPDFDRAFRAHQNTLEQTVMFLPVLWLASMSSDPTWAAVLGYTWLAARLWYLFGYIGAAGKRGPGFVVATLAWLALVAMSLGGIALGLMA